MKIRNLPYNQLNFREKKVVKLWWEEQTKGKVNECKNHHPCNTLLGFWEAHREGDTDFGRYDGWIEPEDELEDIIEMKLEKIKNEN